MNKTIIKTKIRKLENELNCLNNKINKSINYNEV